MLNTGTKNLVSVPVQHKFPALTRLLLTAKLEKLHGSKGREPNESLFVSETMFYFLLPQDK